MINEYKFNTLMQVSYMLEAEGFNTILIEDEINKILEEEEEQFKIAIKELKEAEVFF